MCSAVAASRRDSVRQTACSADAEATEDAEQRWVAHHNELAEATLLLGMNSWWVGANIPGKPRTLYPYVGGVGPFRDICRDVAEKGYEGFTLAEHALAARA